MKTPRQINKTASYTIVPPMDPHDAVFTNAGAVGAITFTLPRPNAGLQGYRYHFVGLADQDITVAAPTADTLVAVNDLAADSVSLSTSSQKIGGRLLAQCLRTSVLTAAPAYAWVVTAAADGAAGSVAT